MHRRGRNITSYTQSLITKIKVSCRLFYAVANNIFCSMPLSLEERTLHIRNTPCIGNQYVKGGSRATRNALAVPLLPSYGPTTILRKAIYGGQVVQGTGNNATDQGTSVSQRSRITYPSHKKVRPLVSFRRKISSLRCFTRTSITYLIRNKRIRSLVRFTKNYHLPISLKKYEATCMFHRKKRSLACFTKK